MAVVVDDVDRAGVYALSSQGRRVQPAATNRHSHISTRRWCISGLAVKQDAYDRSRDFPAQSTGAKALEEGDHKGVLRVTTRGITLHRLESSWVRSLISLKRQ